MDNKLENIRHSCAHLMAAAVKELWPKALPTIGPVIENGFYYDFDFGKTKISELDFEKIEKKMKEILPNWKAFEKIEMDSKESKKVYKDNPYKLELIKELKGKGEKIFFYESGKFLDLCRGGHSENPRKELKNFKLLSVAGAYWRGYEKNKMLTRIYGTCFETKDELNKYLKQLDEAQKRDHRKIGKDLDFFSISPLTGYGLILWHPKLSIVRNEVENFWKEIHYKNGYQLVYTPHISSMDMFTISRHYSKYINFMFPVMLHQYIEGESKSDYLTDEQLKPMNCPNHIQIFKSKPRSYRELPLRMGELGTVYRYERAGVLHGLTRVRGFTQDDSHIFCTTDQVIDEVRAIIKLTRYFYEEIFGFTGYQAYLATRPEKYLGSIKMWEFAQDSLKKAMELENIDYKIDEGQGVFYGPKIDSKVKDSLGREWQLGTIQFDFNLPAKAETTDEEVEEFWSLKTFKDKFKTRDNLAKYLKKLGRGFDVNYINEKGDKEQVVMIHRTILGSMERFFGVLIEHFAGNFPTWLSPVQVAVLTITSKVEDYAKEVYKELFEKGIRVELNDKNETLGAKIRNAQMQKIPYMLIIGEKEAKEGKVALRTRSGKDLRQVDFDKFLSDIQKKIDEKTVN